jgi:hypothetical protein
MIGRRRVELLCAALATTSAASSPERRSAPMTRKVQSAMGQLLADQVGQMPPDAEHDSMAVKQIDTFSEEPEATPRLRKMTIVAQDPSVRVNGRIVTAEMAVPVDRLEPGPRSHRFHVVDYDAAAGKLLPAADLTDPDVNPSERGWSYRDQFARPETRQDERQRFPDGYDATLISDPVFHAQNAYAIAARTLAAFEFALGRRLDWEFDSHQLYLVPHAFAEANAHYAREDRGLFFGYLPQPDGTTVYTCLSHDIVCHETTHAILDGLRPRFLEPALPDQPAFHEALGDIVAILSVFSLRELVDAALNLADADQQDLSASSVTRDALARTVLFGVAEQFGEATSGVRGSALRRSLDHFNRPDRRALRDLPEFAEPHRRGEILVAAVLDTLLGMWTSRLDALIHEGTLNRARAAEEGAKSAAHLMTMVIRSLDYAPAVELEFEDVLDAIIVADEVVAPDDEHDYRGALQSAFERFGIDRPTGRMIDLSKIKTPFRYDQINAAALRSSRQEAFRFLWQNLGALDVRSDWHLQVDSLRLAVRVGPDGLVIQEIVADYVQIHELTVDMARQLAAQIAAADGTSANQLTIPTDLAGTVALQFWGGGTLIFDQFGRVKLHQRKDLHDWIRQSKRLDYLVRDGLFDTQGRLGFSTGAALGMAFADMHVPDFLAGEAW